MGLQVAGPPQSRNRPALGLSRRGSTFEAAFCFATALQRDIEDGRCSSPGRDIEQVVGPKDLGYPLMEPPRRRRAGRTRSWRWEDSACYLGECTNA